MKYDLIDIFVSILDIFNNPIGIVSLVMALIIGILMCIYGNRKNRIICVCSLLALSVLSILMCVVGNSPDYLILPIFIFPFFAITASIFFAFELLKIFIKRNKNYKK